MRPPPADSAPHQLQSPTVTEPRRLMSMPRCRLETNSPTQHPLVLSLSTTLNHYKSPPAAAPGRFRGIAAGWPPPVRIVEGGGALREAGRPTFPLTREAGSAFVALAATQRRPGPLTWSVGLTLTAPDAT